MRNALLSALMISLYALSSTMDFVDAERLRASHREVRSAVACDTTAKACPTPTAQLSLHTRTRAGA